MERIEDEELYDKPLSHWVGKYGPLCKHEEVSAIVEVCVGFGRGVENARDAVVARYDTFFSQGPAKLAYVNDNMEELNERMRGEMKSDIDLSRYLWSGWQSFLWYCSIWCEL